MSSFKSFGHSKFLSGVSYCFVVYECLFRFSYKSTTSGSAYKHGVLNKIVDHVKSSYMSGEEIMYSFEDLLRKANLGTLLEPVKEVGAINVNRKK